MPVVKPRLSFWQMLNMNVGFFGIQFSFGLQQSNMSPIYKYLICGWLDRSPACSCSR
jgi:maltose/moltooligosaccharide transporter